MLRSDVIFVIFIDHTDLEPEGQDGPKIWPNVHDIEAFQIFKASDTGRVHSLNDERIVELAPGEKMIGPRMILSSFIEFLHDRTPAPHLAHHLLP